MRCATDDLVCAPAAWRGMAGHRAHSGTGNRLSSAGGDTTGDCLAYFSGACKYKLVQVVFDNIAAYCQVPLVERVGSAPSQEAELFAANDQCVEVAKREQECLEFPGTRT